MRVHPDGRAIHNRIEKFMRQIGARHHLPPNGASQRPGAFRTPRAKTHNRARLRQRERGRSGRASRPKQQHAAPREAHPLLQAAQDSDVVCIVPVQSPAATHDNRVDSSNARRQRIAVVQRAQNRFLVRNRDRKARDSESLHRAQKISQVPNEKRHKYRVEFARAKRRVVQQRRERMPDRIANHAVHARAARDLRGPVKIDHRIQRELARRRGLLHRRIRQSAAHAQRQDAPGESEFAHRYRDDIATVRANSQMRTLSETEWHCAAILIACLPARSSRRTIPARFRGVPRKS